MTRQQHQLEQELLAAGLDEGLAWAILDSDGDEEDFALSAEGEWEESL